jgi:hypothetical protein
MKYLVIFFLILVSCSPVKRFHRLIERNPELITTDSITLVDTVQIVIPKVEVDTVVKVENLRDTITIQKEQLTVKVWMKGDEVFIEGECDTVIVDRIITRKIPVRYYEKKKGFLLEFFTGGVGLTVLLLFLVFLFYKYFLNKKR